MAERTGVHLPGPRLSAFIIAYERRGRLTRTRRVVDSHVIGGVSRLIAYGAVASGITPATTPGLSSDGVRLADSGSLSIVPTS